MWKVQYPLSANLWKWSNSVLKMRINTNTIHCLGNCCIVRTCCICNKQTLLHWIPTSTLGKIHKLWIFSWFSYHYTELDVGHDYYQCLNSTTTRTQLSEVSSCYLKLHSLELLLICSELSAHFLYVHCMWMSHHVLNFCFLFFILLTAITLKVITNSYNILQIRGK